MNQMVTLNREVLQAKLQAAIKEYEAVDEKLTEARQFVKDAETALEQCRGKVTTYDELLKELGPDSNGDVEEPEVVVGEVIDAA